MKSGPEVTDEQAIEQLTAAVRRVRELHRESHGSLSALYPNPICECGKDYPCPTVRALGAEEPQVTQHHQEGEAR